MKLLTAFGYFAGTVLGLTAIAAAGAAAWHLIAWVIRCCRGPLIVGDDVIAVFCDPCEGTPGGRCTCHGTCGRRGCRGEWNLYEFERELARLTGEGSHG